MPGEADRSSIVLRLLPARLHAHAGNPFLRRFAGKGGAALAIKLANAGLTYLMFMLLARWLGSEAYGEFAFMFALGSFAGIAATAGQHTLVLRLLPALEAKGDAATARGLIGSAYRHVGIGGAVATLALLVFAGLASGFALPFDGRLILLSAVLAIPFAVAEFQAHLMRAYGSVVRALAPRDVVWRCAVIVIVGGWAYWHDGPLGSAQVFLAVGGMLAGLMAVQALGLGGLLPQAVRTARADPPKTGWFESAGWLWIAAMAGIAMAHLSVVVVSGVLSASDTGAFFAAQRTAQLLSLPLIAANMVAAQLIARDHARGDIAGVQRVCRLIAPLIVLPSILGFAIVLGFGGSLLSIFDPGFAEARPALVLLALGQLFSALCGPTGIVMLMTGMERRYVVILAVSVAIALVLAAVLARYFGLMGAAIGVMAGEFLWNGLCVFRIVRTHGIDPTVLSVFRPSGGPERGE